MQIQTRKAVRPCTLGPAHTPTRTRTADPQALGDCFARMAVDCLITLALFKTVPWLEVQITREMHASLGPRPRRCCILGVVLRLTREQAQREGWPWPELEEVVERLNAVESWKGGGR